tara:strand:+ start:365 stop:1015 length:651 start_codon:yes stop_codon:yes gene_type:complete
MSIENQQGQMTIGSTAGLVLYKLAKDPDNQIFVEIGSWNGRGTTQCIMEPLTQRLDDCVVYSLEVNKEFHNIAKRVWETKLRRYNSVMQSKLKLIWGRIVNEEDVPELEEVMKSEHSHDRWPLFYREFFDACDAGCPNVIEQMPEKIDVLVLDGGEFTTYADYQILRDRSKIIFCDDSSKYKCEKVRAELLEDKNFKTLHDEPRVRNGFCVFERIS